MSDIIHRIDPETGITSQHATHPLDVLIIVENKDGRWRCPHCGSQLISTTADCGNVFECLNCKHSAAFETFAPSPEART